MASVAERIAAPAEWLVRGLCRSGVLRPIAIKLSARTESALQAAYGSEASAWAHGDSRVLLAVLLRDSGCSFSGLLKSHAAPVYTMITDLDARLSDSDVGSTDAGKDVILRRSLEVAPETLVGPGLSMQVLHTCHLLWGMLRSRGCAARAFLIDHGIKPKVFSRSSTVWTSWYDAG